MLTRAVHQPLVNFREHADDLVLVLVEDGLVIHDGLIELVMRVSRAES